MNKKVLQVKDLNKQIEGTPILNNISFDLYRNEIISIIGHSGAGKTTLLRVLNKLTDFDSGQILYDNVELSKANQVNDLYKQIGLVFQNFNLFPHLNVVENITLALKLNKLATSKDFLEEANKWIRLLKLKGKENHYPYQLSGGEKQRVAIARAAILKPKILCFDEPTSALDPQLSNEVASIIKVLAQENISILIITHDMDFAKNVSNRILVMDNGEIINNSKASDYF